jgi:AhpD family alkylhydroperoxidase
VADVVDHQLERLPIRQYPPEPYGALLAVDRAVRGLDPGLHELVKLRASQLNGCSFCVDLHTMLARKAGESGRRLHALPVWRDTPFFAAGERAALRMTEAATRLVDHDEIGASYTEAAGEFPSEQLAQLVMAIALINAWNRVGVVSGMAPERPPLARYGAEVAGLLARRSG